MYLQIHWIIGDAVDTNDQTSLKSARAGRASRAGARAGRIVRLVRMVKLYKYFKAQKKAEAEQAAKIEAALHHTSSENGIIEKSVEEEEDLSELTAESHVGAAMSDLTTRRVIVLVLVMLIAIPLLSYSTSDFAPTYGSTLVHSYAKLNATSNTSEYNSSYHMAVNNVVSNLDCLYLSVNDNVFFYDKHLDDLRDVETLRIDFLTYVTPPDGGANVPIETISIYDMRHSSVMTATFGIYMTIFVLFLLVVGTYFFSTDVNRLVIIPIEKMVALVQEISKNPLGIEYKMLGEEDGFLEGMETTLLLQTINKIGGLMKVGFGEAGASVIAKNLGESDGNKLNLMGSGNLIHSIFGFCDVRNFTDTTECLQEEVMLFVNRIAHILHSIVVQCSGSANKNIGDAFLLTWKIDESLSPANVSLLADQALLAFCKSLIELCRYQDFICNFSVTATNRLYKRFPGYKVRIGSGLHVGWAIEGAIGSNMKIDASYLSPHVNMSEYLESSTKAYGVPLLMSEAFFRLLTPDSNKYCRQVDRLKRSETEEPFGLFTYDSDLNYEFETVDNRNRRKSLTNTHTAPSHGKKSLSNSNSKSTSNRDVEKQDDSDSDEEEGESKPTIVVDPYKTECWETDLDLVRLRHLVNDAFRTVWKEGMAAYIKGDWQKARDIFHETMRSSNAQDGPSKFLIKVIDEHGGTAPHDWQGYRQEF
jgi:class 3 adenylate cyclase